ncbi:MAG: hypothetical protein AB8F34_13585 [Akkermansiaceae bacterium]
MPQKWKYATSHLIVLCLGAAFHWVSANLSDTTRASGGESLPNVRSSHRTTIKQETGEDALQRLIRHQEAEEIKWSMQLSMTPKEWGKELLRQINEDDNKYKAELKRLLALSQSYSGTANINTLITEAMTQDDEDTLSAIFLFLYEQDSDLAFKQLSLRPEWSYTFSPAVWLHIDNDLLLEQLSQKEHPQEFKDTIANALSEKVACSDDIQSLGKAMSAADKSTRQMLVSNFCNYWVPRDPAAAARYIFHELPQDHRDELLDSILEQQSFLGSPIEWSPGLCDEILKYKASISPESVRTIEAAKLEAEQQPGTSMPDISDAERMDLTKPISDKLAQNLSWAIHVGLYHQKDYPELLIQGKIDVESIAEQLRQQIKGEEAAPELFDIFLYQKLAAHAPAKSLDWASGQLEPSDLANASIHVIATLTHEPRSKRALHVARLLYSQTPHANELTALDVIKHREIIWETLSPQDLTVQKTNIPNKALDRKIIQHSGKSETP